LSQVLLSLSAAIQESGAVVTHDPLPDVWIESHSLILVLQNLIANAIKYRGPDPVRVHIYSGMTGNDQIFSVRDNGIGIATQYHERIFGIFKRLHGKEIPGTGIGLAICQRIIEGLGGKIWVESEPGKGSTFRFTLPREPRGMQRDMAEFATLSAVATPSSPS
jgi:light-regulated signal transduction histidine kinase (bacteriophytochrome)